jgi:hypothetical protein
MGSSGGSVRGAVERREAGKYGFLFSDSIQQLKTPHDPRRTVVSERSEAPEQRRGTRTPFVA